MSTSTYAIEHRSKLASRHSGNGNTGINLPPRASIPPHPSLQDVKRKVTHPDKGVRAALVSDHSVNLSVQPIVIDTAEGERSAIIRLDGSLSKRLADAGVKWSKIGAGKPVFRTGEVGYLLKKITLRTKKRQFTF